MGGAQTSMLLPVAMCGYDGVKFKITDEDIDQIKKFANTMPVIVMPHMGVQYTSIPTTEQIVDYRKMIDAGADMVLGNHPHWVQGSEAYKGKLIVYSMGNFIFDQNFSANTMRSAGVDVLMSLKNGDVPDATIQAWAELGKNCTTFSDSCLADAKAKGLSRLPLQISYDIVGVDTSNKITKPASLQVRQSVLRRMGWDRVKAQGVVDANGRVVLKK